VTQLISIDEARDHLRIDTDADDLWLDLWISAVSSAVLAWLKDDWRAYEPAVDSNGDVLEDSAGDEIPALDQLGNATPKPQVKGAVLIEIAQHYRFRDGSGVAAVPSHWGYGYTLGAGATALLASLRKTTIV
jgi:hypothetical protein